MTLDELERLARAATPGPWHVQDSNSWRRIGTDRIDGAVVCPINQRHDGHPDLGARRDDLDYIAACSPDVVLKLIETLRAADRLYEAGCWIQRPAPFTDQLAVALAAYRVAREQP